MHVNQSLLGQDVFKVVLCLPWCKYEDWRQVLHQLTAMSMTRRNVNVTH